MQRRFVHSLILASCVMGVHLAGASGEPFPSRSVRIVVPYSAGGPVDLIARGLANSLTESWKRPVVVDNKPGANEMIAATEVARSPADGYTLIMGSDPTFSQNEYLFAKMPYDARTAFSPVMRLAVINMALFVPADFPAKNLAEFVAYAKANPGKVAYGSTGTGNVTHLSMAWLEKSTSTQLIHVPYKGLAPVIQDMLGGRVHAAFGAVSVIEPYVNSGKFKALAISGSQRAKMLPAVPTFAESGYPAIDANLSIGLMAPRGTSKEIIGQIASESRKALFEPAFRAKYIDSVAFEIVGNNPEEFAEFIAKDRSRQQERIKTSGAQLQ